MNAKRQIELLEGERKALKQQKYQQQAADLAERIGKLPRLFQHRIAFMQANIEGFEFLYLNEVLTALEWASEIIKIWPDGDLNSLPKEKIGEICGNDERWLDWKYFALTMAIAWKDDQPENLHPLTSSLVMGVVAPLPILVQPTHVRERDINFYISSAKFREIEDNFLKPMQ